MRTKPPCKVDGVDCQWRRVGCRDECEAWKKYEAAHAEEREKARRKRDAERDVEDFMVRSGDRARMFGRIKYKVRKRRGG